MCNMSIVSMPDILNTALEEHYGVAAFNIVDDVTMKAVLDAGVEAESPVIVEVSVKTVKHWGAELIQSMFEDMASRIPIPTTLHLDHCPDKEVIKECLEAGWNSVLFDGSELSYEENMEQTKEVVALAREYGAAVEGELEAIKGVEDGVGSEYGSPVVDLDRALAFVRETGIDSFAAGIGTAHGLYHGEPKIDFERVSQIVAEERIPLVLHGGSGLKEEVFKELIARGETKVNISTQLKITMADAYREYLNAHPTEYNPLNLLRAVGNEVKGMVMDFMHVFGSEGRA
jgi:fructose-bisphosphate aldolase class II